MSDAAIWIDPARMSGAPCIFGTRIDIATIAHYVDHAGVAAAMSDYEVGRRDVLSACAWWTLYSPHPRKDDEALARRWHRWAKAAMRTLWVSTPENTAMTLDPPRRKPERL